MPFAKCVRRGLVLAGCALLLVGCSIGGSSTPPSPTPTKTPKPTFTATVTATFTPEFSPTPTDTATPEPTPTDTITPTPEVPPTPTDTATPEPTNTPNVPPTATRPPAPPTATFTPAPPPTNTPVPVQWSGSVVWDDASAQCGFLEIRKDSYIQDAGGGPINGVCVCVNLFDNIIKSNPSGPGAPGYYGDGHYDISPLVAQPADITVTAFVCDCGTSQPLNSDYVSIPFQSSNCAPGQGGHQSAVVNWRKNW